MYLFYIDESGNTGSQLVDTGEPVHWLVALGIHSTDVKDLEEAMSDLADDYCFPASIDASFELHGGHIFHGRDDFNDMSPEDRVELYQRALGLLDEYQCQVAVRGIHKERHHARASRIGYSPDHPHKLGFMYLMEQIDEWLERQQPEDGENPTYGLVVADVQREVNRDLIERFPRWRDWGTDHGYRTREIEYLIDTIHTVPSHDSWLIQLADCIAYIRNRWFKIYSAMRDEHGLGWLADREEGLERLDQSETAVHDMWYDRVSPQLFSHRVWPGY